MTPRLDWFEELTARGRLLAPDLTLAIRSGMLFLLFSACVGAGMTVYGRMWLSQGLEPGLIGPLTLLHGASMHAVVQWLPALAWALAARGVEPRQRHRLVVTAVVATACLTAQASVPALACQEHIEGTTMSRVLLTAALAGFLVPVLRLMRRRRAPAQAALSS